VDLRALSFARERLNDQGGFIRRKLFSPRA